MIARAVTAMLGAALAIPACGGDDSIDLPDAEIHQYRITAIELPWSTAEVYALGFDLDGRLASGDQSVDNQLGSVHASFVAMDSYYEVEAPSALRLTTDVGWMLAIHDGGEAGAAVVVSRGERVDGALVPVDADAEPIDGRELAGVLTGGRLAVPLGTLSDASGTRDPEWVEGWLAHAAIESFDQAGAVIRLGFAIEKTDVDRVVVGNLCAFYTDLIARGLSEYASETWDHDRDGVVTQDEFFSDPLMAGFFFADIAEDYVPDSSSVGMRITAIAVE